MQGAGTVQPRTAPAQPTSGSVAEVQVSTSTPGIQELQHALANAPVVNTDRVKEIKQAIAEGRFRVDPEKIADGLIDNVKQMLRDRRQA
ncbi:MAG: flagellar biosynthesis anti-sigma factor FlgM [Rhodocyclaceae bacterium]|nr:MAG: flagellar biosynthesis anti-sigma factor FlgM [Rhodocyclaceae bacterium]